MALKARVVKKFKANIKFWKIIASRKFLVDSQGFLIITEERQAMLLKID